MVPETLGGWKVRRREPSSAIGYNAAIPMLEMDAEGIIGVIENVGSGFGGK